MLEAQTIPDYLRTHKQAIADDWERAVVRDHSELASLERAALLDHLPEILDALAAWIADGETSADALFSALADGHALQRLGYGIELEVLHAEYRQLRHVLLTHLLAISASPHARAQLIRLNDGLDSAIHHAVQRYCHGRDMQRDRFIGILGHDLRNPLASAAFAVQMLTAEQQALGPRERRAADAISRALSRMARLVDDVLDFSRAHLGGGIPSRPVAVDLGRVCAEAVREVQAAHPQRAVLLRARGDLNGTFDPDRVSQCMVNLLSNAVQHGSDPITLTVAEADDRRSVLTRVSNRGEPIPEEIVSTLFDPFTSGAGKRGGLGLGLFIVAEIARAHGATCDVSSRDGETSFSIRWPRTPREETPSRP